MPKVAPGPGRPSGGRGQDGTVLHERDRQVRREVAESAGCGTDDHGPRVPIGVVADRVDDVVGCLPRYLPGGPPPPPAVLPAAESTAGLATESAAAAAESAAAARPPPPPPSRRRSLRAAAAPPSPPLLPSESAGSTVLRWSHLTWSRSTFRRSAALPCWRSRRARGAGFAAANVLCLPTALERISKSKSTPICSKKVSLTRDEPDLDRDLKVLQPPELPEQVGDLVVDLGRVADDQADAQEERHDRADRLPLVVDAAGIAAEAAAQAVGRGDCRCPSDLDPPGARRDRDVINWISGVMSTLGRSPLDALRARR